MLSDMREKLLAKSLVIPIKNNYLFTILLLMPLNSRKSVAGFHEKSLAIDVFQTSTNSI